MIIDGRSWGLCNAVNVMDLLAALDQEMRLALTSSDEQWEQLMYEITRGPLPPSVEGPRFEPELALTRMMEQVGSLQQTRGVRLARRRTEPAQTLEPGRVASAGVEHQPVRRQPPDTP